MEDFGIEVWNSLKPVELERDEKRAERRKRERRRQLLEQQRQQQQEDDDDTRHAQNFWHCLTREYVHPKVC